MPQFRKSISGLLMALVASAALGALGVTIPYLEHGVSLSVVLFGLMLVYAAFGLAICLRRGARLRARASGGLWELRPTVAFDLRRARLPVGIAHTVVDLVAAEEPLAEWAHGVPQSTRFNFDRALS